MTARRELLAEKLMDVANSPVAATLFGQFVSGQPFRVVVGILAIVLWAFIYCAAYFYLLKERE